MGKDVLIVASKYLPEYTGAAFRINTLYKTLKERGALKDINLNVLSGGIEFTNPARYVLNDLQVERLQTRPFVTGLGRVFNFYRNFIHAYNNIRIRRPDLIHSVGSAPINYAAYYYAYFTKTPIIFELVTAGAVPIPKLPVFWKVWFPHKVKNIVFVTISDALMNKCRDDGYEGVTWNRPNPIDAARFYPRSDDEKKRLRRKFMPFDSQNIVISMVAKFMPQKNQRFLIDVMTHLPENFKLVLAGPRVSDGALSSRDAQYFEALEQAIVDQNLKQRIHIIDKFIDNPEDLMGASDLYAMPNMNEGLGTPMLEALACGVPVIANAAEASFRQHIKHGVTGFLEPLDVKSWADAILKYRSLDMSKINKTSDRLLELYSLDRISHTYQILMDVLLQDGLSAQYISSIIKETD